jgi:hypothetical protein
VSVHIFFHMTETTPGVAAPLGPQRHYKNLEVGCHVSGSFGEYQPNPYPNIHWQIRTCLFGNIICVLDRNRYKVAWDNGTTSDCYSNSLSKETTFASLPPDVQPPLAWDRLALPLPLPPPKVKKQWTTRQKPMPKMKGILQKRCTCQKLGGGGIRFV